MKHHYRNLALILFVFISFGQISAQYSSIEVGKKQKAYRDSLMNTKYDYIFPIWGQKVYEKGFDIPYPVGLMANFIWVEQNLIIDNLQLGLEAGNLDIPLTPVDFIEFGENISTVLSYNFRPDVWIFPFLNVYGLFGTGRSRTEVNLIAPIEVKSVVDQNITTTGFGVMFAGGIGTAWFSVDGNWTWSKPELLDDPVSVTVFGLRLGKTFKFKNKPESNIAIWAGLMSNTLQSETYGQLTLGEALPELEEKADEIVNNYNSWYDELTRQQQLLVDQTPVPDIIDRIAAADGSAIIKYGMDKQVKQKWNGVIGGQYQLNKRWMLRSEAGVFGNRKSFLVSLNYRFLM